MRPASEGRLQKLHPALVAALRRTVADLAMQGIAVEIVQGLRTFEEQDALYAKGRTQPGQIVTQARGGESNHNYGLAADLCPYAGGKPDWNAPVAVWAAIGAAATAHGLSWGGAWKKFIDKPHVELPAMTVRECLTCFRQGGIDAVWTTASKKSGWDGEVATGAAAGPRAIPQQARALPGRKPTLPRRKRTLAGRKQALPRRKRALAARKQALPRRKRALAARKQALPRRKRTPPAENRTVSPRTRQLSARPLHVRRAGTLRARRRQVTRKKAAPER
jgi:peptidoglycan L-alanyl-D-glutamate endopeptidase CwlK